MHHFKRLTTFAVSLACAAVPALADEPCGEIEECRALIEINASDGDIGFHVLVDAEGWQEARMTDPNGNKLVDERAFQALRDQKLTEIFFESAEPVCELALAEEEDDEVVTLPEFLDRFPAGTYSFRNKLENGGEIAGSTVLTHNIPAAPEDIDFDGSAIHWEYGDDLGECTTWPEGFDVADEGDIVAYEVVMEPEEDELGAFTFVVRVPADNPGGGYSVTVPAEYLTALGAGTEVKVEVGAIEERDNGSFGNQTFSEEDGFCVTADGECAE